MGWALTPQSREAKHPTQNAQGIKTQTNNQQQSGKPSASEPVAPDNPKPADGEGASKTSADKEQPVRVAQPIAITTAPDKATWLFNGLLILVGFLQAWILFGTLGVVRQQAKAADDSLALSRDTAQRQLRAYVCVSAAKIEFKQPDRPEIEIRIKNSGTTPAYNARWWTGVAMGEYPLDKSLSPPPEDVGRGVSVIPPGGEGMMLFQWKPAIPAASLPILGSPKATLYIYGRITYTDAFEKNWETNFRLLHGGPEGIRLTLINGVQTGRLKPDAEGNTAT